jgi:putative spermidine/putrescine transport system permease protein
MEIWRRLGTGFLLAPAVSFLVLTLVVPVIVMFLESVRDTDVRGVLPATIEALEGWQASEPVPDAVYKALARDLERTPASEWGLAANRLNIELPGARAMVLSGVRGLEEEADGDPRSYLLADDERWAEPGIWQAIREARGPWTGKFLLAALDLKRGPDGSIVTGPQTIYRAIFVRTFVIALSVTAICLVISLPVAVYVASLPQRHAAPLLLVLMLPLWTSVLVRAMAWILLLQNSGLVNQSMMFLGILDAPVQLVFNRIGVIVAMTHVLLPFMILPMYNAMRSIPRNQLRAAGSLGASPLVVFRRVYLPQCRAGIAAGCVLVFASASGYYITPALVGGGSDQMLGSFVGVAALRYNNLSLAAALGAIFMAFFLLIVALLFLWLRPTRVASPRLAA